MAAITGKKYRVHYYEIDVKKRALVSSIINYLMDVCMVQTESKGVGIDYLRDNNVAWVLYQWQIKIHKYPTYEEEVTAYTKAHSFNKFYAYRKNWIENEAGELMVEGKSSWFLIDVNKRRPVRIGEDMYKAYNISEKECERFENIKLKPPGKIDSEKSFTIRYSDIDTNEHVNNVKYISWAIESVPVNIALEYDLEELIVTYEKETYYGETICAQTEVEHVDNYVVCHHKIVDKEGRQLTLAKTTWMKK